MINPCLPITWGGYVVEDTGLIRFICVEFTRPFGPFGLLEKVPIMDVDFIDGRIDSVAPLTGVVVKTCTFVAIPERRRQNVAVVSDSDSSESPPTRRSTDQ